MDRIEAANRMEEIGTEISDLVDEARRIATDQELDMGNLNAYVFDQILEHVDNNNPHNQSLMTIQIELEKGAKIEEGDYVHDRGNPTDVGEVMGVLDGVVRIMLDDREVEITLPLSRVVLEEKGPQ